jgi:hypothetical protein
MSDDEKYANIEQMQTLQRAPPREETQVSTKWAASAKCDRY